MADQSAVVVFSQCHITMWTFQCLSAGTARDKTSIPSSVQKKYRLFASLKPLFDCCLQTSAQYGPIAIFQFLTKIHDRNFRKRPVLKPGIQFHKTIFSVYSLRICFQRWCRRPHHQICMFHLCAISGRLSGMISGTVLTFVCLFMFFINNNQAKPGKGCKQC